MKRKKVAKLMAVVALVGTVGVGGSLALLTAQTKEVTNTFTVGAGLKDTNISIDETNIDSKEGERTEKGNNYKDIGPDMTLVKDPQVHLTEEGKRADAYVFVKITGLDEFLDDINMDGKDKSTVGEFGNNWRMLGAKTVNAEYDGIYVYSNESDWFEGKGTVVPGNQDFDEFVFKSLYLSKDADLYDDNGEGKSGLDDIVISACAVQATDSENSWTNAVDELPEEFLGDIVIE